VTPRLTTGRRFFNWMQAIKVRLVAFKRVGYEVVQDSLRDQVIEANEYYGVLSRWQSAFLEEWSGRDKEVC
jgi:hypothetical protein